MPATWRVRYRITVHNTAGADVEGVVVTDTLPAGTCFVWADQGGVSANGRVTWSLGTLPAGEARTLRLDVSSFSSVRGEITNQVAASYSGGGPVSDSETTTIVAPPP